MSESRIQNVKHEWETHGTSNRPTPVACLHSLSFDVRGNPGPWEDILLRMTNVFNFSQLQSLDMSVHTDPGILS